MVTWGYIMDLLAWFKKYYQRHKAFRAYYCDRQLKKIAIGNITTGALLLIVQILKLKAFSS